MDALNSMVFGELNDAVNEFLTESNKKEWFTSRTGEISAKHGISEEELKDVSKSLISLSLSSIKLKRSKEQLLAELKSLGASEENSSTFLQKWEVCNTDIAKGLSINCLSINRLVDMEWKFGVTAASSESKKVGNTFLQLKLVVNNGDQLNNVYMELSLSQFYGFLHEMEKAKACMEYFE